MNKNKIKFIGIKSAAAILAPVLIIGEQVFNFISKISFTIWGAWNHICYMPKLVWESPEAKSQLKQGGNILIANHTSHKDGSFLPHVLGIDKTAVLVTRKWYDKPAINLFFKALNYIPINLEETDTEWEEKAKTALENGMNVLIFPEGKLSEDGTLGEFLPGFLLLARHTGAKVIPIAVSGGYQLFKRQTVKIGNPVDFDATQKGRPSVILKKGAEICKEKIQKMMD